MKNNRIHTISVIMCVSLFLLIINPVLYKNSISANNDIYPTNQFDNRYLDYSYELFETNWNNGGYYAVSRNSNFDTDYTADSEHSFTQIQVIEGQHYIIRGISNKNLALAILYNEQGQIAQVYRSSSDNLSVFQAEILIEDSGTLVVNGFTYSSKGYPVVYQAVSYKAKDTKFSGKTVLFSGDSITNGYGWDYGTTATNRNVVCLTHPENTNYYNLGWAQTFAEDHRDTTVYGYGVNGTRISLTAGKNSITERINVMDNNADYVVFSGGINDCFKKVPLGKMVSTDSGNNAWKSAKFDTSTYCGALETLFRNAYNKWPNAKIAFIITGKNTNCMKKVLYDVTQEDFVNATIQICNKWSIPYLDLYHNDGLCTALPDTMSRWFANDQTHPNERCYREKLRYLVEDFMQKL